MATKTKGQVATILEKYRGILGKSERQFAVHMGTTPQNYNHIKAGRQYPSFIMLATLNNHGYSVIQLFN